MQSFKTYHKEYTAYSLQQNREEIINSHLRTLGAKQPFPNLDWKLYPRRKVPNVSSFLLLKGQQAAVGGLLAEDGADTISLQHAALPVTFITVPCKTQISPISHSNYPHENIHQESNVNTRACFLAPTDLSYNTLLYLNPAVLV